MPKDTTLITADEDRRRRASELYMETLNNLNELFNIAEFISQDSNCAAEDVAQSVELRDEIDEAIRELGVIIRALAGIAESEPVDR